MFLPYQQKFTIKLVCACFLSFIISFSVNGALNAITSKAIQGTSPRFNVAIENVINLKQNFKFFGVNYQGTNYFSQSLLNHALAGLNPKTVKPEDLIFMPIIDDLTSDDATDSDGDVIDKIIEKTADSVNLAWYYNNGSKELPLTLSNKTFCELAVSGIVPYIKISGQISLTTQYGYPDSQDYPDSKIAITQIPQNNFTIPMTGVCYASPNLSYASDKYTNGDTKKFLPTAGYIPQDDYSNNFPTTGANKLYFYLVTLGLDLANTEWKITTTDVELEDPITVKVENRNATKTTGFIAYKNNTMALVTLMGPDKISTNVGATAKKANVPVDITISGWNGNTFSNKKIRGFSLIKLYGR